MHGIEWCSDVIDEAYIQMPFLERKMEPLEWPHCLEIIDLTTLNHGIKLCDDEMYDTVSIRMIHVIINSL